MLMDVDVVTTSRNRRNPERRPHEIHQFVPAMTSEQAFRMVARTCLDDFTRHQRATSKGNADALHRMRIANMRLRSVVSFFSPMTSNAEWKHLKRELKWLNGYLGSARDIDVILQKLTVDVDNGRLATNASYNAPLKRQQIESHRRLTKGLQSKRYRRLIKSISDWVKNGRWSKKNNKRDGPSEKRRTDRISTYSARILVRWYKKILKKSRRLECMGSSQRHRLRIKTKKLRYTMEFFGYLLPVHSAKRQRSLLKHVRKAQDSLGNLNDAEKAEALTATMKRSKQNAMARKGHLFGKKHEKHSMRAAKAAYRRMAKLELL